MIEVSPSKKGERWERIRLNALKRYPLADILLSDLLPADIAEWRDRRLTENVEGSTVRRELILMSGVFTRCRMEWNWINENPVSFIQKPRPNNPRDRRINSDEVAAICKASGYKIGTPIKTTTQLVGALFLLGIETGMRLGEMCKMRPFDIFLDERFVRLENTKNTTNRTVSLSKDAGLILNDVGAANRFVASGVASSTFKKICKGAKIVGLRFHDTRHEAITRLSRKLQILDLAKMVGTKDLKTLMIYYNPTAQEIAARLD
ncbi:MAG: tyrosine-type recombinase/integrase [Kordiimonadaceae bacterium]|nr:tyrosine-type recombinase/integrase [Kordiimonadaceae bacterium]